MNLSTHFTLEEATVSETASREGIDNTPSTATIAVMTAAATQLENVRSVLGFPLHINSWYRSPALNTAVGSHPTSQHLKGEAIDFICPSYGDCVAICKKLMDAQKIIRFDQLILEHTWVHISFAISTLHQRGQVLSLLANGGYFPGLTDKQGVPV